MSGFRFGKMLALAAAIALLLCGCSSKTEVTLEKYVFDTYASGTIYGGNSSETAKAVSASLDEADSAFAECYEKEAALLTENALRQACTKQTSLLTERYGKGINLTCGALSRLWGISTDEPRIPTDVEIAEALKTLSDGETLSEGAWLDFGAVAKGFACDRAYSLLKESDTEYAVISLGSSTLLYGEKPSGKFRAGVTNPDNTNALLGVIEATASFISTSGGYERYFEADGVRYSHILDTETGRPVETDLTSVTVIVPADTENGGIMSDFLATLIYIQGTAELDKWLAYDEFEIVAADVYGVVHTDCEGFTLDENGGYTYE